jgi:hypothetical protein
MNDKVPAANTQPELEADLPPKRIITLTRPKNLVTNATEINGEETVS